MAEHRKQTKAEFWTKTPVIICMAFISCFLWGSAFPSVKTGYRLLAIAQDDAASQILFAGFRFALAGLLVLLAGSLILGRVLIPRKESVIPILIVSFFQTTGQYFFFYIGTAHTSGVNAAILVAAGTFFTILISCLIFRYEKLTWKKLLGCLIGFAGILLMQIPAGIELSFTFTGEGFVLLSSVMYAFSSSFLKKYSKQEEPLVINGWQFLIGGIVMILGGAAAHGEVSGFSFGSGLLLFYMAVISAGAYSLWGILLKYKPVSQVAVFGFMNPVIGVILSALILGEQNQAFTVYGLGALVLVSLGIVVVNLQIAKKPE